MKSFTYDKVNQLVTSTVDNKVTNYAYDAAGRLIKEGSVASGFKTYSYGYLDKILEVQKNGQQIAAFDYHVGGQIASAVHGDKTEKFLWDGLALIHRGDNSFINEPYVTGGNPILSSKDGVMFNDMLGTTLGIKNEKSFNAVNMTAFGEPTTSQPNNSTTETDKVGFFTGKPYIGELGYAFLFRNYRADQGKWQTKDPLGYPDGWNNLAYVNNGVIENIDWLGAEIIHGTNYRFLRWEYVTTYAIISMHNGYPDGTNITDIIWGSVFSVYRPVYAVKCVTPNCIYHLYDFPPVTDTAIAGPAIASSGHAHGTPFIVVTSAPIAGAPASPTDFYYQLGTRIDSYPTSPLPSNAGIPSGHTHKLE